MYSHPNAIFLILLQEWRVLVFAASKESVVILPFVILGKPDDTESIWRAVSNLEIIKKLKENIQHISFTPLDIANELIGYVKQKTRRKTCFPISITQNDAQMYKKIYISFARLKIFFFCIFTDRVENVYV